MGNYHIVSISDDGINVVQNQDTNPGLAQALGEAVLKECLDHGGVRGPNTRADLERRATSRRPMRATSPRWHCLRSAPRNGRVDAAQSRDLAVPSRVRASFLPTVSFPNADGPHTTTNCRRCDGFL